MATVKRVNTKPRAPPDRTGLQATPRYDLRSNKSKAGADLSKDDPTVGVVDEVEAEIIEHHFSSNAKERRAEPGAANVSYQRTRSIKKTSAPIVYSDAMVNEANTSAADTTNTITNQKTLQSASKSTVIKGPQRRPCSKLHILFIVGIVVAAIALAASTYAGRSTNGAFDPLSSKPFKFHSAECTQ